MADILFSMVDRKEYIDAPTLVRWRSRYRGPRESIKINTESSATLYDLRRLYEKQVVLEAQLTLNLNSIEDGGLVGTTQVKWGAEALAPVSLLGIDEMNTRVSSLRKRLESLDLSFFLTNLYPESGLFPSLYLFPT